jgi:hypothetical protein
MRISLQWLSAPSKEVLSEPEASATASCPSRKHQRRPLAIGPSLTLPALTGGPWILH